MATKKKYEFKGLDELFGESVSDLVGSIENNPNQLNQNINEIDVDLLVPNEYQPRKTFDAENLQELSESIKQHGVIQPIIIAKQADNTYQIVAGERRTRAAKLAGLKKVPVVILELTPQQMHEYALIENIQRVDLTDIEEAIAYKQLIEDFNLTQEQIAQRVNKSRSHIANTMRLLNLPDYIKEDLLKGIVTMGQTKPLLSILSNPKLVEEIFNKIMHQNLSAREVEKLVKQGSSLKESPKTSDNDVNKSPNILAIENQAMKRLGTKVAIKNKKIIINYSDTKDLNRILELLKLQDD